MLILLLITAYLNFTLGVAKANEKYMLKPINVMELKIAANHYLEQSFSANKKLVFDSSNLNENTLVVGVIDENAEPAPNLVFINADFEGSDSPISTSDAGKIYLVGMLKLGNIVSLAQDKYWVDFGENAGIGNQFMGSMGARLKVTFSGGRYGHISHLYNGPTMNLIERDYLADKYPRTNYVLDLSTNPEVHESFTSHVMLCIEVARDANQDLMLDENVSIHVFDYAGNLLTIIDADHTNPIGIPYHGQAISLVAVIKPTQTTDVNIGNLDALSTIQIVEENA